MSKQEVNDFFEEIVYGFILGDIEREIALAKSRLEVQGDKRCYSGGGNYLCALGLLCYTEFMGAIRLATFEKSPHNLFNAFFYLMGPAYEEFDKKLSKQPSMHKSNKKLSVYEVFRCGMAHEYFIKKSGVIFMLSGNTKPCVDDESTFPCGIGMLDNGQYFFVVEQYYEDFAEACHKVHGEILRKPNPSIPKA
jgi:hypothetical protein